jgi:hypothetical protein
MANLCIVWSFLQVLLEKSEGGSRVGYIYNTHLQAYQGTSTKHSFLKLEKKIFLFLR